MGRRSVWRSPKTVGACPVCDEVVHGTEAKPRTYCSKACANRARAKPAKRCRTCSSPLTNRASTFCSPTCHQRWRYESETKPRIERGRCSVNSTLKTYLIRERGAACETCGCPDEWNGKPLALHVDHIDGDSDNNFPTNLRLLCPNCHTQTDTYTARNRKNAKRNRYLRTYKSERTRE